MSATLPNARDTRAARDAILSRLRAAAPTEPLPQPSLAAYHAGPFGTGSVGPRPDPASLVTPFESAARGWRAEVLLATAQNWPEAVQQVLAQRGCQRVAIGAGPGAGPSAADPHAAGLARALAQVAVRVFDAPLETWKPELFDRIDAGVTGCVAGIADTGTLVLRPGPHEPRTLSLVPPLHIALLHRRDLYASLPAAMAALQLADTGMPTNLVLVTGPSKTADIQQVLAFGAHGPKELVIVLIDD